jgi:hypothetical protein
MIDNYVVKVYRDDHLPEKCSNEILRWCHIYYRQICLSQTGCNLKCNSDHQIVFVDYFYFY